MNANERDAMALAVLRECAEDVAADDRQPFLTEHRQQRGKRIHAEYIAAVDRLAGRIAELEADAAIGDRLRNMLILCGEPEAVAVEGMPEKLRALIDGLIVQRRRATRAEAELAAVREDGARLDWMDANGFTAYRSIDPISGISGHCVVVHETQKPRRGNVAATIRAAIDTARGGRGSSDGRG